MKRREPRCEDDCKRDLKFLSKVDRTIITDVKDAVAILLNYELLPAMIIHCIDCILAIMTFMYEILKNGKAY